MGLVLFVEVGIYALTFLVAPLVDRMPDKRGILLVGFPIQAVAALVLGLSASRGELHLPLLLGIVAVLSVIWDFEWAVFQVAPRILLTKDELFAAQGVSGALGGGASIGGFAAGAVSSSSPAFWGVPSSMRASSSSRPFSPPEFRCGESCRPTPATSRGSWKVGNTFDRPRDVRSCSSGSWTPW